MAPAVRGLSPVSMTVRRMPSARSASSTARASARGGSAMQSTAASSPPTARYRWEYSAGRASNFSRSPSGMRQRSSSKMKWALPMRTCSPSTELAMPWATRYSTLEWRSAWSRPRRLASATTALAIEWGKCSSRQAASRSISASSCPPKGTTCATRGQAWVKVPVLSKTMVSARAAASRNLPPLTVIWSRPACRMAERTASGMASLSAQEKSTISTDSARLTLRVSARASRLPAKVAGTSRSARREARASAADFICSDFWIISTIWS